ncbi:MAG: hypothetical protein ABJA67_06505 [Chthonomonadales bacterium]
MRKLFTMTDNPVALYSARKTLPGSLQTDQIVFALVSLSVAMIVVNYLPQALSLLIYPFPLASAIFPPKDITDTIFDGSREVITGLSMLTAALVGIPIIGSWTICRTVTESFRLEREKSTLGFVLLTPLSSRGLGLGHCIGALLPSLAIWAGASIGGLAPVIWLWSLVGAKFALTGYFYGFFLSLLYILLCVVTGLWIGITEGRTRDVTIGVYLLPLSFCVIGAGSAFYTWRYWNWGFYAYNSLFVAITVGITIFMWRNSIKELNSMRVGDVPFEGRVVSS